MPPKKTIPPTVAIFLTVFLDILSFGSVIPDVQLRAEDLIANWTPFGLNVTAYSGILIGLTLALYSIAQFAIAPYLGKLSDNIGRRKVLIVTCALAVVAAAIYAYATNIPIMWISRIFLGFAGANLGVAYAYASDISTDEDRSKTMGLLGAAFGLGFIFGPVFGAYLLELGNDSPFLLGWASAVLAAVNLFFVLFFLPESRTAEDIQTSNAATQENRFAQLKTAFQSPNLRFLLILFFVANFAFANLETTYYRIGEVVYQVSKMETTYVLIVVGIAAAITQGGLVRLLEPKLGETRLLRLGYAALPPSLAVIPFIPWGWPVFVGAAILGVGNGLAQPSLNSLISKNAPKAIVGGIFGVTQSLGAFARIIAPIVANALFNIKPYIPYIFAAILMLGPTVMAWFVNPEKSPKEPSPTT